MVVILNLGFGTTLSLLIIDTFISQFMPCRELVTTIHIKDTQMYQLLSFYCFRWIRFCFDITDTSIYIKLNTSEDSYWNLVFLCSWSDHKNRTVWRRTEPYKYDVLYLGNLHRYCPEAIPIVSDTKLFIRFPFPGRHVTAHNPNDFWGIVYWNSLWNRLVMYFTTHDFSDSTISH